MATGRHANSHESPHGADFDVDENWHVDFGHAGVRQMSVRQIAEAWQAGAMLESTLVWHEGLADWEEVLAVPQIARAIDALAAASEQGAAYYEAPDDLDDASSDWDATVVETTRARGGVTPAARAVTSTSTASPRSLPPPPNARGVGAKVSSSLPPPPDVKAAFETHVWAHSTPPPPELPFARDVYSRHERAVEALRFPRPSSRETPEAPTAKVPPVTSLPRRERTSSAGLPARPNPSSLAPHSANTPLSVVRVGGTSLPVLLQSDAAEISSRRLLLWGSLGGAALGAVLLLLWRLIAPSHASDQNSLNPEAIEQASETATDSNEETAVAPAQNEAPKAEAPPAPVVEEPAPAQAVVPEPEAPPIVPPPSDDSPPASAAAPAAAVPSKAEATQATSAPAKSEVTRSEEAKRAQSVIAPSAKSEAPPAQKEKAPSSSAPSPPADKPAAPSARAVEEEPPPSKAPAAPSAPDPAFNKEAAVATLNTAAVAAGRCPGSDAKGPGTARVVFSPDGSVRSVSIVSGDFEATAAGACVTRAFQRCKVPPFAGKPAAVSKQFVVK